MKPVNSLLDRAVLIAEGHVLPASGRDSSVGIANGVRLRYALCPENS